MSPRARHLKFTVEVGADVPATLVTDGRRLQQILRNLLSNAFKFTSKGGVTLKIERVTSGWGRHVSEHRERAGRRSRSGSSIRASAFPRIVVRSCSRPSNRQMWELRGAMAALAWAYPSVAS